MPLVGTRILMQHASRNRYAVAAINTNGGTYDLVCAIAETAEQENAPIIMAAYQKNLVYRGFDYTRWLINHWSERINVPVAAHLDHGNSVEVCRQAMEAGFSSVMIDGSHLPIDQNIALVKQVVALAKPKGVSVEAEVGELQKLTADGEMLEVKNLADPQEVARMTGETGIDMLAVGIGNAHGFYKGVPNIRLDLLEKLKAVSKVPLVLHGTTGIPDEVVQQCIRLGVAKVNLGTLVRTYYVKYTAEVIAETKHQHHPWRVCQAVKDRIKQDIRRIIRVTGSAGQAPKIQL